MEQSNKTTFLDLVSNRSPKISISFFLLGLVMLMAKISKSQKKLKAIIDGEKGVDVLFTTNAKKPVCNSSCNGCYYFAQYNNGFEPISSEDVPFTLQLLKEQGFTNPFLITSELLLADNWDELVKQAGYKHLNTNGKQIALGKHRLLEFIEWAGIEQIVITANIPHLHDGLNLTAAQYVESAFGTIQNYHKKFGKKFSTGATVIVTSDNYKKIQEMATHVKEVYQADFVKFLCYLPLEGGVTHLMPSLVQVSAIVEQINELREQYDPGEFYVQRSGTLGTQQLSSKKANGLCPAGDGMVSIKSMQDGAPVVPCIFVPEYVIGITKWGKIVLEEEKLGSFLEVKQDALSAGYCPAHYLLTNPGCSK